MLDIKLINRGSTAELLMKGRLDNNTAQEALELCRGVTDRFLNLTLNMEGLQYISSAGLRVLISLYIKVNKAGGEMQITNASPMVAEVLEMTGMSSFLKNSRQ